MNRTADASSTAEIPAPGAENSAPGVRTAGDTGAILRRISGGRAGRGTGGDVAQLGAHVLISEESP